MKSLPQGGQSNNRHMGVPPGALECNMTGRCPFFKNLHNLFRKKLCISIPCFGINRLENNRQSNRPIVLEQNVMTCLGIIDQSLYPVQEFRLKIDTLKNVTSRIGLYGSAPWGGGSIQYFRVKNFWQCLIVLGQGILIP